MKARLIIFARAPRLGSVKTRLAQEIGEAAALAAYEKLLRDLSANLAALSDVTVLFTPSDAESDLSPYFPRGWSFAPQEGRDLGASLTQAFAATNSGSKTVVIGSDCPQVSTKDVEAAFEALDRNDLVLGPATDGGYWLAGLKSAQPRLFQGINWSTATVLQETLDRAAELNLRTALLRELRDVDTAADWEDYLARTALT